MSFNTIENFRKAKRYLKLAFDMEPTDYGVTKTWNEYQVAENMLNCLQGMRDEELIPDFIFQELRPGLAFLRAVHGPRSAEFKRRLTGDLRRMEQDARGELADLYEKVVGVEDKKDPVLKAFDNLQYS